MFISHLILIACLHSSSAFGPISQTASAKDSKSMLLFAVKIFFCCFAIFVAASWLLFTQQGKNLRNRTIKFGIRSKKSDNKKKNKLVEIEMLNMKKESILID